MVVSSVSSLGVNVPVHVTPLSALVMSVNVPLPVVTVISSALANPVTASEKVRVT